MEGEGRVVNAIDVLSYLDNFPRLDNVEKDFAFRILAEIAGNAVCISLYICIYITSLNNLT